MQTLGAMLLASSTRMRGTQESVKFLQHPLKNLAQRCVGFEN